MDYLAKIKITQEDRLSNFMCLSTLEEVYKAISENYDVNTITFHEDFVTTFFNGGSFEEFVDEIEKLNPNLIIKNKPNPIRNMLKDIRHHIKFGDLDLLMQFNEERFKDTLLELINYYENSQVDISNTASIISNLNEVIQQKDSKIDELKNDLDATKLYSQDLLNKLDVLVNRINYSYGHYIDRDRVFRADSHFFNNVLYFKEISRVQYTDTFIVMLQKILMTINNIPTRVLVIEPYYASGKVKYYPYLKLYSSLNERDVLKEDILMLGFQPKLFGSIMQNAYKFGNLIILDRGGYHTPHLISKEVEYLFIASDAKDVEVEGVPESRIISYEPTTLNIPLIKDYHKLSLVDKFHAYSSIPIMNSILKLLKGGTNV